SRYFMLARKLISRGPASESDAGPSIGPCASPRSSAPQSFESSARVFVCIFGPNLWASRRPTARTAVAHRNRSRRASQRRAKADGKCVPEARVLGRAGGSERDVHEAEGEHLLAVALPALQREAEVEDQRDRVREPEAEADGPAHLVEIEVERLGIEEHRVGE